MHPICHFKEKEQAVSLSTVLAFLSGGKTGPTHPCVCLKHCCSDMNMICTPQIPGFCFLGYGTRLPDQARVLWADNLDKHGASTSSSLLSLHCGEGWTACFLSLGALSLHSSPAAFFPTPKSNVISQASSSAPQIPLVLGKERKGINCWLPSSKLTNPSVARHSAELEAKG